MALCKHAVVHNKYEKNQWQTVQRQFPVLLTDSRFSGHLNISDIRAINGSLVPLGGTRRRSCVQPTGKVATKKSDIAATCCCKDFQVQQIRGLGKKAETVGVVVEG